LTALGADVRGAAAVEFAIVAPALILLLLAIIEGGKMLWMQNALQYAVERAARCAVVDTTTCGTPDEVQSYAASLMSGTNLSASVFTSISSACGQQVSASLAYTPILPIPMSVTLSADSCRPS
jgi:Flp pilus assembly protein TadG